MNEELWNKGFEGKKLSTDWTSRAFVTWVEHLAHLRDRPLRILEIGAWEGRSTIFFLRFFPTSVITRVDLFTLGNEPAFDANVAEFGDRIVKIASTSRSLLAKMCDAKVEQFDLIYVDGSHDRHDVMIDTLLAWRLLSVNGIMIWDDYDIDRYMPELTTDGVPKSAINTFREWHADEIDTLDVGYQIIVRKTKLHFGADHS